MNGIPLGEGEITRPLFADGVALHRENPKKPLKNLLRLKKIVHQSDRIRGQYTTDKYTLSYFYVLAMNETNKIKKIIPLHTEKSF